VLPLGRSLCATSIGSGQHFSFWLQDLSPKAQAYAGGSGILPRSGVCRWAIRRWGRMIRCTSRLEAAPTGPAVRRHPSGWKLSGLLPRKMRIAGHWRHQLTGNPALARSASHRRDTAGAVSRGGHNSFVGPDLQIQLLDLAGKGIAPPAQQLGRVLAATAGKLEGALDHDGLEFREGNI